MLIEHYAGAFPTLAGAGAGARGRGLREAGGVRRARCSRRCAARGLRVDLDLSNDKLGAKIRRAQLEKIPYMLVVGDKEVAAGTVAPRCVTASSSSR